MNATIEWFPPPYDWFKERGKKVSMQCPYCKGTGKTNGLGKPKNGPCVWMDLPCLRCDGTGNAPDDLRMREYVGNDFRLMRKLLEISIGEAADILHLKTYEISYIEMGKINPPDGWRESLALGKEVKP